MYLLMYTHLDSLALAALNPLNVTLFKSRLIDIGLLKSWWIAIRLTNMGSKELMDFKPGTPKENIW